MQAHFSSHTLAEIFRDLYMSERQGVLALVNAEIEKRVYFDRGLIVHAESDLEEDDLGRWLAEAGTISGGALNEARQAADSGADLAEVLLVRDLVGRDELRDARREMISGVIRSVFNWESGEARFEDRETEHPEFDTDILKTCQVLLAGIQEIANFEEVHRALLRLDRKLRLKDHPTVPVERLRLSPENGFVLSRIDGETSLKEIVSLLPATEEDRASRFLYGLLVLGIIEFDPPVSEGPFRVANLLRDHADRQALESMQERMILQAYDETSRKSAHAILGVEEGASSAAIAKGYEEAKAMFSADRLLPSIRSRFKSELTVIESRLIEAYVNLSRPEADEVSRAVESADAADGPGVVDDLLVRVEMDKTKSKIELEKSNRVADSYFQQARKALREADFHNAIQFIKLAISYNDNEAGYFFLLAECQVRNPGGRWQHHAEQNFKKAAELDPWNADYRVRLGQFYKKRGLHTRATSQFEEALRLSPNHEQAMRELSGKR